MSRPERLSEQIKKEIATIIREKVSDSRIGFVSIISVKTSVELKECQVFYSVLGDEKAKKGTAAGLKSASSFIRGELGKNLDLRFVPKLRFIYDEKIEKASNVLS